jgi:hypothetical protein
MQALRISLATVVALFAAADVARSQQFTPQFPTPQFGNPQQQQPRQQPGQQQQPRTNRPTQGNNGPAVVLPSDEKLLDLHKAFVAGAEKLAGEYEKANQMDKARACYAEIIRLVPTYTPAVEKMNVIKLKEESANKKPFDVFANKGWQDTGINVVAGKPISIKATGSWTMKMEYTLPPDGIEIPKELRNFPLGALVGKVMSSPTDEEAEVFLIGSGTKFTADKDGRLVLRIYDEKPEDNSGKMTTMIEGTFSLSK